MLWIGSFYIQLLDPVYLARQFSEITVEIDKEHLNTQNLLLKPLSAVDLTGLYRSEQYTHGVLVVVHYDDLSIYKCTHNYEFIKIVVNSEHVTTSYCWTPKSHDFMHLCLFSTDDVTHV